ncbi:hypothetical protein [Actinocrispum sp. NPDC049592]|uniref:hypothetical protein n=1 Tax=Actinocrispum sp. NPDC049592 TaxID=3154835 RepID=UPI003435A3ED
MPDIEDVLVREFTTLRRGWGLQHTVLRERMGPTIARWCELPPGAGDRDIRRRIGEAIEEIELGPDTAVIIRAALAIDSAFRFPTLSEREEQLAQHLHCSVRTARRRVEEAFRLLAQEIAARRGPDNLDDPDRGWLVRRFRALVRLDRELPELIEERTIVAVRDGVRRISARFSVPPTLDGSGGERAVTADVMQGARITTAERQGQGHFYYILDLPRQLERGDELTYTMVFQIQDGKPIRDYFAFVPLTTCESFHVRVRFDPARLPRTVWKLDRTPPRVLADPPAPGPPLPVDGAGEVGLQFTDLERGYGYGLSWLP